MRIITHEQIVSLNISPATCIDWVRESFSLKKEAILPPKISLHPQGDDFINTMPCVLPAPKNRFAVKIVSRIQGAIPSLNSLLLLMDTTTGEHLAIMDANWITTMRTGAVATLAARTLRRKGNVSYGFMGLGNTARATLLCMLDSAPDQFFSITLLKYKGQEIEFINRFSSFHNISFRIASYPEELIETSDVIVSCVTSQTELFCDKTSSFKKGCLIIPVHTRGFQNCDLEFDKVFGDDTAHIHDFKYFNQFKSFGELSDVLEGIIPGRESDEERILSYNIGLGLHDLVFASKIYSLIERESYFDYSLVGPKEKFWL